MEFTEEHDKFILECFFRTGTCDNLGNWQYSFLSAQEQFAERFTDVKIDVDFCHRVETIVQRFRDTGSVSDGPPARQRQRPLEEDIRPQIQACRAANPNISIHKLAALTGASASTVKRIVDKISSELTEGAEEVTEIKIEDLQNYDFSVLCEVCGKQLANHKKLHLHLRIHNGYKPHICEHCCKSFTKKESLIEHVRVHTGEKPFKCKFCGRAFSQRSPLKIHERIHTGERPYPCRFCKKCFISKASMDTHMKMSCQG